MANKLKFIDSFLHNLKILIKEASTLVPDDPLIYRINKQAMLCIQYDPSYAFNKVGEKLYKYKDFIYDTSTESDLKDWNFEDVDNIEDKETQDGASMIISELKRCLTTLDQEKKIFYRSLFVSLLDDYLEYKCM
jgi:hypothetical protein